MSTEQQRNRYEILFGKMCRKELTPPEEVEYDQLSAEILDSTYTSIPSSVRQEIEDYLEEGESDSIEFYQGMIHAVRWVHETASAQFSNEVERVLGFGLTLLSLSVNNKMQKLKEVRKAQLTKVLELKLEKETPDDTV